MGERKWVTREEIAEIHDSIADRDLFDEKANYHREAAQTLRDAENLRSPGLGWPNR